MGRGRSGHYLRVACGDQQMRRDHFKKRIQAVEAMNQRIQIFEDSQIELCRGRVALGISKANHILRAYGAELFEEGRCLEEFDDQQEAAFKWIIPGLNEEGVA